MKPIAPFALAVLALTACNVEPKQTAGGTAQGEVLPAAASDAMLPLDTLKSQAPLAPKVEGEGGDKASGKVPAKPKTAVKPADAVPVAAPDPAPAKEE